MTHEQRALAKSVQKVRGVLDRYPDGVTISQITGDTQLSSGAARAALKHMGAECEDGLWFDVAEPVEQSGNAGELEPEPVTAESVQQEIIADFLAVHGTEPVAIAESAPVELVDGLARGDQV